MAGMNTDDLLRELGAKDASQVSIQRLPVGATASEQVVGGLAAQHGSDTDAGKCVASCGGKTSTVTQSEASDLIARGAKDARKR